MTVHLSEVNESLVSLALGQLVGRDQIAYLCCPIEMIEKIVAVDVLVKSEDPLEHLDLLIPHIGIIADVVHTLLRITVWD